MYVQPDEDRLLRRDDTYGVVHGVVRSMEKDEVQAPAPHRQNSLCPLSGPFYNIYRKQGRLSLFQEPQLRPVRQPHQRLQQRPFRSRAHMLDDPLPRSLAGYAG